MKTFVIGCLLVLLGSTGVSASDGAHAPGAGEVQRPFRSLFAAGAASEGPARGAGLLDRVVLDTALATGGVLFQDAQAVAAPPLRAEPNDLLGQWHSKKSITWGPLLGQSLGMLAFQAWFRATFEEGTWAATLEGPFWDDYVNSVKGLCCWDDGDKGTTNWLFHPMLGSAAAFVFANNHRDSQLTPPGNNGAYWGVKGKQLAFSFAYSTYFELGPLLSEAAIGNVGLDYSEMTWKDIIVTPTLGTAFSIGEDLLRVYVIDKVDRKNHFWGATLAIFLNPTRSFANLFAFKVPWSGPAWLAAQREAEARSR